MKSARLIICDIKTIFSDWGSMILQKARATVMQLTTMLTIFSVTYNRVPSVISSECNKQDIFKVSTVQSGADSALDASAEHWPPNISPLPPAGTIANCPGPCGRSVTNLVSF